MKIRTTENLVDFLHQDFAWRKKELSVLEASVYKSRTDSTRFRTMIRSGVTVLYAHWEGFVRSASTGYLEFVSRYVSGRGLRYRDVGIPFVAIVAKARLDAAKKSEKASIIIEATEFLLNRQDDKCIIPWKKAIKTRSNLSSKVLREIIALLGLDYTPYITKEKLIDNILLHYRNNIAHGKELYPTYEHFKELYSEVRNTMQLFNNQVQNAAVTRSFIRN